MAAARRQQVKLYYGLVGHERSTIDQFQDIMKYELYGNFACLRLLTTTAQRSDLV